MTSQFPNWMINNQFSIHWPVVALVQLITLFWCQFCFTSCLWPTVAWFSSCLSAAPSQSHLLLACPVSTVLPHPQVTTLQPLAWSHSGSWLPVLPMSWLPSVHFSLTHLNSDSHDWLISHHPSLLVFWEASQTRMLKLKLQNLAPQPFCMSPPFQHLATSYFQLLHPKTLESVSLYTV